MFVNDRDAYTELLASCIHCITSRLSYQNWPTDWIVHSDSNFNNFTSFQCERNHQLLLIVCKLSNCFAKKFMKRRNASLCPKVLRPKDAKASMKNKVDFMIWKEISVAIMTFYSFLSLVFGNFLLLQHWKLAYFKLLMNSTACECQ